MRIPPYVVGLGLLAIPGVAQAARCTNDAAVAEARAAAEMECVCATAENHGDYVSCVAGVANRLAKEAGTLPDECKGAVVRCAAKSTCGKPDAVTCCRIDRRGKLKCSIKKDAEKCRPPRDGAACVGSAASCCDACPTPDVCQGGTTTSTSSTTSTTVVGSPSGAFFEPTS